MNNEKCSPCQEICLPYKNVILFVSFIWTAIVNCFVPEKKNIKFLPGTKFMSILLSIESEDFARVRCLWQITSLYELSINTGIVKIGPRFALKSLDPSPGEKLWFDGLPCIMVIRHQQIKMQFSYFCICISNIPTFYLLRMNFCGQIFF